jgi:hypothetical protein
VDEERKEQLAGRKMDCSTRKGGTGKGIRIRK